ncbi:MAG: hypothetical protein CVU38_13560 [Chloroflexi bacterium HGW-Chloroflexi-1]|nr:MAG: hypothetical protein CVU38_13560 [Chloroflexi bacterium HGW-Chloroflexi-1]
MTQNDTGDPVIQISEEKMQKFGLILIGIAVLFTIIGGFVSPIDDQGKPVLLLPEVKAVEDYRQSAQFWITELSILDGEIAHVIVDRTRVPPIGMGLHEQMLSTTLTYLEAARSALQWVSAPEKKNQDSATLKLEEARKMKTELEANQWLKSH